MSFLENVLDTAKFQHRKKTGKKKQQNQHYDTFQQSRFGSKWDAVKSSTVRQQETAEIVKSSGR